MAWGADEVFVVADVHDKTGVSDVTAQRCSLKVPARGDCVSSVEKARLFAPASNLRQANPLNSLVIGVVRKLTLAIYTSFGYRYCCYVGNLRKGTRLIVVMINQKAKLNNSPIKSNPHYATTLIHGKNS